MSRLKCQVFRDKHGKEIKAGCLIKLTAIVRLRERPGQKRVAHCGMSDQPAIVPDEGKLLDGKEEWVTFRVGWSGACMVAEREGWSDFQRIMGGESAVDLSAASHLMNCCFKGEQFEVVEDNNG